MPEKKADFKLFTDFVEKWSELHQFFPFKDIVFISDFPQEISRNHRQQLHADMKPALSYRDTYSVYALNGVRVDSTIALTPASELNPKEAIKEKNVEVRRELFRKIGLENMFKHLNAKILDKNGDYELVEMDLGDDLKGKYLKMKNPSIDVVHVEGVISTCNTVHDALRFRNRNILETIGSGNKWTAPKVLT
jgi:hypothetical protein